MQTRYRCRAAAVVAVVLMSVQSALGQWSGDPNVNLAIGDRPGEQVQPKIVATSDGGCYISWFDNATGGYDVYLQRLDSDGNEAWMHNGILIADRGFSSTQNYSLAVDAEDHALLTFRDDRFAGVQITATRIAPDEASLWGPTGVQLTNTSDFVAAPKITATSDGRIVVAWTQEGQVKLRKLLPNGTSAWLGETTITDPGGDNFSASDLHAAEDGSAIVSMIRGFFGATLHASKVASNGSVSWSSDVFDGGALQVANFPTFVPDCGGGAVFGWYGVGPLQCYTQRLLADGSEVFAHDGVVGSTQATRLRVSPSVSFDATSEEIFLFWTELNGSQSQWGVYGQKFSVGGNRQWTDSARSVVPLGSNEITQVRNLQHAGGAMVFWVEALSFGNDRLKAARLNDAGDFVWAPSIIEASSTASDKSRLAAAMSSTGLALLAWSDDRADSNNIYAQSVNADGVLGGSPCATDLDGDGTTNAFDLAQLLGSWGPCLCCPTDFNGDGIVDAFDLAQLLGGWGPCS